MLVPEAAQPRLRLLYSRYQTARAAFYLYLQGVAHGMGLEDDVDWDLNTETMVLNMVKMPGDGPAREVVNGLQSKRGAVHHRQ